MGDSDATYLELDAPTPQIWVHQEDETHARYFSNSGHTSRLGETAARCPESLRFFTNAASLQWEWNNNMKKGMRPVNSRVFREGVFPGVPLNCAPEKNESPCGKPTKKGHGYRARSKPHPKNYGHDPNITGHVLGF